MEFRDGEFERLRDVLAEADEPLTAREILERVDERGTFDTAHRVATVLGRRADREDVRVVAGRPYRYQVSDRRGGR